MISTTGSAFSFFDFFDLEGVAVGKSSGEAVEESRRNAASIDEATWVENTTVSCRVSARVEVQLGEDPRYFARISRHIKADCAMPSLSCSVSPFSPSASSVDETGARHPLTAALKWDVKSKKRARCA
jgi:hypothetical protein